MAENDQERTEQASSRKREEARKEGNFAVSKELSSFLMITGTVFVLYFSGLRMFNGAAELMKRSFSLFRGELSVTAISGLFRDVSYEFFMIIFPALLLPVLGAASYALQNGFSLSAKPLEPQFSRIDPISGFKRLLSIKGLAEVVKSILKLGVLGYVVYVTVSKEWATMPFLMDADPVTSLAYTAKITLRIMVKTIWVLAVIAVMDYAFQRWQFEKSLRMTKEELKEEAKQTEGDPAVKARIRSIQRELARKRMMQAVPTADVVITNPTHIAVAIKYDRAKSNAPVVVAKGAGVIAEKIRELAKKNRVPLVENKPLARALYKQVEIGMEIPVALYKAVAEILAYVYRLKGKVRR